MGSAREMFEELRRDKGGVELIDWAERVDLSDHVVEGLAIPGRWTALVAGAKVGKSTLLISLSVEVSEGRDPWTGEDTGPVDVLYLDTEMGRIDIEERLEDCEYDPAALERWHACELVPRLDTPDGAARVLTTVAEHEVRLVVIDGLNGTVTGAERDDTPWRDLYEHMIHPLKVAGCAIVSADNHGKDETLGPRGSSVKMDKADAIVRITRTSNGVSLRATHRRTAAYFDGLDLVAHGLDLTAYPTRYRRAGAGRVWPAGTTDAAKILDELGVDPMLGRDNVRARLKAAAVGAPDPSRYQFRNDVLGAAIAWRRYNPVETLVFRPSETCPRAGTGDEGGTAAGTSEADSDLPGGTGIGDRCGQVDRVGRTGGGGVGIHPPSALPPDDEPKPWEI